MSRHDVLLIKSRDFGWAELASVLKTMDSVRVVAEAACPQHGLDVAARLAPDVILAAARIGGVALPRVLLDLQRGPCPRAKIVFFSTGVDADAIAATAGLRYDGWLL